MSRPGRGRIALVTGATGYIGSRVGRRLLQEGWRVHLLVRPSSDLGVWRRWGLRKRIRVHATDGSCESLHGIVRRISPTVVFHLASHVVREASTADVSRLLQSNLLFGSRLLQAMAVHGVRYFVNTGTFWQFDTAGRDVPMNVYAATKGAFEDIVRGYVESTGMRAITLVLFDVYGPQDPRRRLLHLLGQASRPRGKPLALTPGRQLLDMVYVQDVARAYPQAARILLRKGSKPLYRRFALRGPRRISLRGVVAIYERVFCKRLNLVWGGRPYRPGEIMKPWKGRCLPGWRASVGLAEGILLSAKRD